MRAALLLVLMSMIGAVPAAAQDPKPGSGDGFSVSSLKARYGANFNEPGLPDKVPKSAFTFDNTAGWSWGGHYLFVDVLRSWSEADANAKEVYGEWYPSLSLRKISGRASFSPLLRDIGVTVGLNTGVRSTGPAPFVVLPGVTFELNVPAFRFLSVGAFAYVDRGRFEGHVTSCGSATFQVTPSWSIPFSIGRAGFLLDGFVDVIGEHGDCAAQVLLTPLLKFDLSRLWNQPGVLHLGVEWGYWHNKYGVEGVEDSVIQPSLIWVF